MPEVPAAAAPAGVSNAGCQQLGSGLTRLPEGTPSLPSGVLTFNSCLTGMTGHSARGFPELPDTEYGENVKTT